MVELSIAERGFRDIVLIVDRRPLTSNRPTHLRRDLEMVDEYVIAKVMDALRKLNLKVHVYSDPRALSERAAQHAADLVWPLYGGQASRNRLALVPAICEAHALRYIGPDAYGQIICHDKEIAKNLARVSGLTTPWHRLIRTEADLPWIRRLPTPFVVKPVLEGSSIGISQRNLVTDAAAGIDIAAELLRELDEPVMIEEFIAGREASYNYIESASGCHWAYSEIHIEGRDRYFDSHLYDAAEKLDQKLPRRVRTVDHILGDEDRTALNNFITAVGTIVYCRIDGKHSKNRFVFLEATPDAHLWPEGALAASFINKGWTYVDVIAAIINGAIQVLPYRSTSG